MLEEASDSLLAHSSAGVSSSAEQSNERTCGRRRDVGRILTTKTQVARAASVPSIPSRVETTVFKGYREVLGFGSHTLRFNPQFQKEVPGPGEYGDGKSFQKEFSERTSWGARGTGGFASRSRRFGVRSVPSMPQPGFGCPGPGVYNPNSAIDAIHQPKSFSKAQNSAVFARPAITGAAAERLEAATATEVLPGPGQYSLPSSLKAPPAAASTAGAAQLSPGGAPFKSSAARFAGSQSGPGETPGPGQYVSAGTRTGQSKTFDDVVTEVGSSNFKEPCRRHLAKVHPDLPLASAAAREVLGDIAEQVSRVCKTSSDVRPGPGQYKSDARWQGGAQLLGKQSSGFASGGGRREWAIDTGVPGPKYNPEKGRGAALKLSSAASAFNSVSGRTEYDIRDTPGPAYYKPKVGREKKSFHLNIGKEFVSC